MVKTFAGRTAVVTGAGSGIGRALALRLAREGMHVAVVDIRQGPADAVAHEVRALGVKALAAACDVSDRAAVRALAARVAGELGNVHVLCNNAGVTSFTRIDELDDRDWDWLLAVDVHGVTNGVQAFVPAMMAHGEGGHVVNTSSMAGLIPSWAPQHVPYTLAKAGIVGMSVNMRPELAARGVGVSVLCPGGVVTNILDTPQYRPQRFGGPGEGQVPRINVPPPSATRPTTARSPEQVAEMVFRAIRDDELFVLTDDAFRDLFEAYTRGILAAFDVAARFSAEG